MKSILIVDDDEVLREMLGEILQMEGFAVSYASDGETALRKSREKNFDIITLDIALGEEDGRSLVSPLRTIQPHTRIFLLTGMDGQDLPEPGNYGADGQFSKGQPLEKLLHEIGTNVVS